MILIDRLILKKVWIKILFVIIKEKWLNKNRGYRNYCDELVI